MKNRILRVLSALLAPLLAAGCAIVTGGDYEPQYMEGTVTRGPLALQILAQGSVSAEELVTVSSPYKFVMAGYYVSPGQMVEPETVICEIPAEQIADSLKEVQDKILAKRMEIATTDTNRIYYSYKAPAKGRVKAIQVKKGDDVAVFMEEKGYVALVSTERRMTVLIPAGSLAAEDAVSVTAANRTFAGVVTRVDDSGALISIPDDTPALGTEAVVTDAQGKELGRGPLDLASYVIVDAVMGEVNSIPVKENALVEMGTTVVVASKLSGDLVTKYKELEELRAQEQELLAMEGGAPVMAGISGVVMELPVQPGTEVLEDAPVATIAQPDSMIVKIQVDELDVASVFLGQTARIQAPALSDVTFTGSVTYISNMATIDQNDYTATPTFSVYISLDSMEGLSMGMSVLCYLIIQEQLDVLQVPVGALTTMEDGGLAVRVIDENAEPKQGAINPPYTLVPVTVGMKNQSFAEILSGLTEGQRILYDPWSSDVPFVYDGMSYEGDAYADEGAIVESKPVPVG